jgi:hypothetical protein
MKRLVIVALLVSLIIPATFTSASADVDCGNLIKLGKEVGVILYVVKIGDRMGVKVNRYFWLKEMDDVQKIGTLHCLLKQHDAGAIMVYDAVGNRLGFYVRGSRNYIDLHLNNRLRD